MSPTLVVLLLLAALSVLLFYPTDPRKNLNPWTSSILGEPGWLKWAFVLALAVVLALIL